MKIPRRSEEKYYADDTPNEIILVPAFTDGYCQFFQSELIIMLGDLLENSLTSNRYNTYYVGGTLCIDYYPPYGGGSKTLIFNVEDANMGFTIQAMVAKLYIENKTSKHSHWAKAQEIKARSNEIVSTTGINCSVCSKELTGDEVCSDTCNSCYYFTKDNS